MKRMIALLKTEWLEHVRCGKILFLGILFFLLGVMNPAVAKLTPYLLELLSESLEASGMIITATEVTALDSWMQFYKNLPMGLIAFILIESSIFTKEYQSGTMVLSLTKGLPRYQIVLSKGVTMFALWTASYWLSFGVTYAYNAYFWDNSIAKNLGFSAFLFWIFGWFAIALLILFSVMVRSNIGALVLSGGVILTSYLLSILPRVNEFLPTLLLNGASLIYGATERSDYVTSLIVTLVIGFTSIILSIPLFNKKQL